MGILSAILGKIGLVSINIVSAIGYPGVFVLMALENMIFPLPSELVMPFAGFLAAQGKMSFAGVIIASSLGSLAGSLISYYMGLYGGKKFIVSFGKYFLLDESDLERTEIIFSKRGNSAIFISRFIPVVRHLISIPAGIGKMNLKKFCFYTVAGATIWNTILAYAGYYLGENWELIRQYSEYVSLPVALLIVAAFSYFIYKHIKRKVKAAVNISDNKNAEKQ